MLMVAQSSAASVAEYGITDEARETIPELLTLYYILYQASSGLRRERAHSKMLSVESIYAFKILYKIQKLL